jgi:L-lactate dehydrogenase complex protein LldE
MRVGLFVTCLVDLIRPRIGFCALRLLAHAGCEVVVPDTQTCCGQPGYNSGDTEAARVLALKIAREFEGVDYVVAPSGSCAGMIRHHYPNIFRGDPESFAHIQQLADRTYELTDFLVNVAHVESVPGTLAGNITYHDSCAGLRELGIKAQPRSLLARIPGLNVVEMPEAETCCGFGGTFSVKFGAISARLAENKCKAAVATGADTLVLGDLGCILNIEGRLSRRGGKHPKVLHVAEVLAGTTG